MCFNQDCSFNVWIVFQLMAHRVFRISGSGVPSWTLSGCRPIICGILSSPTTSVLVEFVPTSLSFSLTSQSRSKRTGITLAQLSRGRPLCRQEWTRRPAKEELVWAGGYRFWTRTGHPTRGGHHGSASKRQKKRPWVYEKGGRPAQIISTLEVLAVLISLRLFFGGTANQHRSKIMVAPTWTDHRGNGSALNKLMSTKIPTSARNLHQEDGNEGAG